MKRAKKKTKRQRKLQHFEQKKETEQKMQQQVISDTVQRKTNPYYPLEANTHAWLVENRKTATSDKFLTRLLANGYSNYRYKADGFGYYEMRAINCVKSSIGNWIRKPTLGVSTCNRRALALTIREVTGDVTESETTSAPAPPVQQTQSIQRIDASRFVLKDDISEIVRAEIARLQSTKQAADPDALSADLEKKCDIVNGIMARWVRFKCEANGTVAGKSDFSREYGKLYEKVSDVRDIEIPRDEITKNGGKIIHWLASNGHIDATLNIARRLFTVEAI